IEQNHDENGIIFPVPLAPYTVIVLNLGGKDEQLTAVAEKLYKDLQTAGLEVLIDDRDERPGLKFKDADLLGIPYRLTIGKSYAKSGRVEVRRRRDGDTLEMSLDEVVSYLYERIIKELGE
ncbi:MAG: His/Gly/Thr/Pro-type tRNA ligase C-terminal domain-containing protein, partial [Pseudomonadota bacterium]